MFRTILIVAAVGAASFATGCASIVGGVNQPLSVTTNNNGNDVSGARCSLTNDKGVWYLVSPGSTTVRRSYADLTVNCALDGTEPGIVTAKSKTKPMAFGNIIFGGVIGAGVDVSTGAAYDYPERIAVEMGKTQSLAPKASEQTPQPSKTSGSYQQNPFAAPLPAAAASAPAAEVNKAK